jgi:hypothetical protein
VFAPPARWLKVCVAIVTTFILFIFLIALPPARQSAALDYTRDIPLSEAIGYSLKADWSSVLTDHATGTLVWFVPVAIACVIVFAAARRVWLSLSVVGLALLFPAFVEGPRALLLPIITIFVVPALFGQEDGETWSEGFVALGCIGAWMLLWIFATAVFLLRRVPAVSVEAAGQRLPRRNK